MRALLILTLLTAPGYRAYDQFHKEVAKPTVPLEPSQIMLRDVVDMYCGLNLPEGRVLALETPDSARIALVAPAKLLCLIPMEDIQPKTFLLLGPPQALDSLVVVLVGGETVTLNREK